MNLEIRPHPPFEFGCQLTETDPGTRIYLAHAFVKLSLRLGRWNTDADGTIQLVRLLHGSSVEWRMTTIPVDRLRPLPAAAAPEMPGGIDEDLERFIAEWRLTFFRQLDFGMVSELAESRSSFDARVARMVKNVSQKKIREIEARPERTFFWQRQAAVKQRESDLNRVTGEGLLVTENVESLVLSGLLDAVVRVELGPLLLVPGTKLPG